MSRLNLVFLLALTACGFAEAEQATPHRPNQPASASATRVEVARLHPSSAAIDFSLPGEVTGGRDALLASALGGYVEKVAVEDGAKVRKGQVLVRLDSAIYGAQVASATAQLELTRKDLARLEQLGDLATEADIDRATTQVKVAEATLALNQAQYDRAVVDAPFAGTISGLDLEVGEVVGAGSPLMRLVSLDPVRVSLSVPDRDVVSLRTGMVVQVDASARANTYTGVVTKIGATADLNTRAFTVEVEVPNPDLELLPGMIVRVNGRRTVTEDAVVLPQEWVVTTLDDQGVFLARDGIAVWRPVKLGALVRDQVVVTEGLKTGDDVVITGHRDLADGDELLVSRQGSCCTNGRATFGADAVGDGGE